MRFSVLPINKLKTIAADRNEKNLVHTGLYTEKAGMMLNAALWRNTWSEDDIVSYHTNKEFYIPSCFGKRNKMAKITKCDVEIFIANNGEVLAYVHHLDAFSHQTLAEKMKAAKWHLADLMKWYFRTYAKNDVATYKKAIFAHNAAPADGNEFTATKAEYRVIYETLKERDLSKIIANNGQEAVDSIVGKPVLNELSLNAIAVLNAKIEEIRLKANAETNEADEDYHRAMREASATREMRIAAIRNSLIDNEAELNRQIKQLMEA